MDLGNYDNESFEDILREKELVLGTRYRPLSIVTFAIEYGGIIGDLNPTVSHFINILLYGFTGIILMMVLTMLFRISKQPVVVKYLSWQP
ncbi:MAG: hypothetical protein IPN86_04700 [Saprospiraceae bacterium]|nr:hypothetical protein [Saprospiraceae bacterium]